MAGRFPTNYLSRTLTLFGLGIGCLLLTTSVGAGPASSMPRSGGKPVAQSIPVPSVDQEMLRDVQPQPTVTRLTSIRPSRTVRLEVTAYCPCSKCCGPEARGITASGLPVSYNGGAFVAADTDLFPFKTNLQIPGYHGGKAVPVIDRGGAIKGRRLDVFFRTHQEALEWGRRTLVVTLP